MIIYLNGKEEEISEKISVAVFLKNKNLDFNSVVVELNQEIVETEDYSKIVIKEKDKLEILRFVGGG